MEIFEEFISQENDMEKTLEEKKELAAKVIAALKKEYPDNNFDKCTGKCKSPTYLSDWELCISTNSACNEIGRAHV